MSYRHIDSGGGLDIEPGDIFDFACCCCGLVHTVRVSEGPKPALLRLQMARNTRGTSAVRRGKAVRARLEALVFGWIKR